MDYQKYVDQLFKDVLSFAEKVTGAAKQKTEQAKVMIDIKKAEMELEKAYRSLGRIMYQIEKGMLTRDDLIVGAAVRQVEYQENTIEELKKKLEEKPEPQEEAPAQEAPAEEAPAEEASVQEAPAEEAEEKPADSE
jgi:hypothetical protein